MNKYYLLFCLSFLFVQCENFSTEKPTSDKKDLKLVWSDEFDKAGAPDATKWGYDLGDGCPNICGWGNNQLEHYTDKPENVRVENGHLIIEAHKEKIGNSEYSSARLVSKGKGDWKYGKIEIRAKLPKGLGTSLRDLDVAIRK